MPCFQFGLRTLFIIVTLLAIPLGYLGRQAKIVSDRQAMLARIRKDHGKYGRDVCYWQPFKGSPISWIREQLGDQKVDFIDPPRSLEPLEISKIQKLFPEAVILKPPDPSE